jgi:hypothetical protein
MFSVSSLAGFGLILYALLAGSRQKRVAAGETVALAFSDSAEEHGAGIFDLDMGHEGLKHRGKEPFDRGKHKPEPIETKKIP